ncbi:hypothetical protein EMIHUDRAFT_200488 [Emiliania huxleyi CCMP1516]|uniref:Uncharacterized protein n=2 Tax=Emiliania huxleyi TaxID=2903 RepID=A0A0D3KQN0_EMIH1|nr:hypothetical protein EMIHUDRAFT_200488 [Emiliania huxleyi CCMP1516]EOD38065.1 hypothetical protein EMIHUDRAFT_200488 [Emiliania huxleyi CCMP1516]|eukprot:XP_005790494.1 hypothetical protein EMIHUDRAFT_200488 [Emiliania huxleyi CCMP1516]
MVLHSLSRVAPGLLALRPKLTADSLKPGRLLRVGSAAGHDVHAAVLCWCGGVAFAAPIAGWPHAPAVICGAVPAEAAESAVLLDDSLGASPDAVDAAAEEGGVSVIDCFGAPLDSPPTSLRDGSRRRLPLMAVCPGQADLQPICASLHTGTGATCLFALGRSMLLMGERGTGKSAVAIDAAARPLHCVAARSLAEWICERADRQVSLSACGGAFPPPTILAEDAPVSTRGSASEGALVAAAACAVGERVRDGGGHALVVVDGHVQLLASEWARGVRPALRPAESIARVGVGSDTAKRPRPASAAMLRLSAGLRLELAQAEDLPAALGDAHTRLQQTRARALAAVLGTHREGVPLALSQQVALLLAILDGRAAVALRTPEVAGLLDKLRASPTAAAALRAVDESEELAPPEESALLAAIAEHMPRAGGRGLFASWQTTAIATRS